MKDSIDSLQQHTQQYWNIDGLAEIAIGGFFLLLLLINRGFSRFYLLAAASFLSGLLLAYANAAGNLGHAAFYGLMGAALILSGALTLRAYLLKNTLVTEDEL